MVNRNRGMTILNGVSMRKSILTLSLSLLLGAGAIAVAATTHASAQSAGNQSAGNQSATRPLLLAQAQTAPAARGPALRAQRPAPSPEQQAQRRAQMCKDMNARAAGRLAYLETRLELTPAQRGAFNKWRDVRLAAASQRAQSCATAPAGRGRGAANAQAQRPSPVDRMARQEQMLRQRLATITAERPALEALYNSLTAEQRARFQPDAGPRRGMGRGQMRGRPGMMQGRMGGPRGGMMQRGPQGTPPVPPAQ